MENNNKRVVDNRQNINDDEKMKINMRAELDEHYTMLKECPKCGTRMIYAYGEVWANPDFANKELGWKAEANLEDTLRSAWNWQLKLRERGIQ